MTENTSDDNAATFAAGTDHAINAPADDATTAPQTAPEAAPVATAPTDNAGPTTAPGTDTPVVSDNVDAVADDAVTVPVPTDAESPVRSALDTDSADVDALIRDIHKMVSDVHRQVMSIVPLVEQAGPTIDRIAAEVKDKGVLGLLPHILSGMRG